MRKASLLTIFLIVFIDLVGFGIVLPNLQLYGETFNIKGIFFLVLMGPAYSLFQFIFSPILGKWSDRVGRRPVLIVSQAGTLAGFLLLFGSHFLISLSAPLAISVLYFSRVLDGVTGGNISVAFAYVADITTPANRAKGFGLIGAAFGGGFVFGPAIGGIVGQRYGLEWVAAAAAVFSAGALVLTLFTLAESHPPGGPNPQGLRRYNASSLLRLLAAGFTPARPKRGGGNPAVGEQLPRPLPGGRGSGLVRRQMRHVIGMLILMAFVNGFAFAGMEQTFSLLLQQRAHLSNTYASGAAGYLFFGIGMVIFVMQGGLIGRLTKAFGEAPLVITGPFLIAIGLLLLGSAGVLLPTWTGFIVGSAFLAVGSSIFNPSIQSLVSRRTEESEQGEVLGAFQGMASLARGLGPLLAGALYAYIWTGGAYYGSAPYYFSAVLCVVVSVWAVAIRGKLSPPAIQTAAESPESATPHSAQ